MNERIFFLIYLIIYFYYFVNLFNFIFTFKNIPHSLRLLRLKIVKNDPQKQLF